MLSMKSRICWFVIGLLAGSLSLSAGVIDAASCQVADVNQAIGQASNGDVVRVPAGQCTWSSDVVIQNRAITLQGAGKGVTVIRNGDRDNGGTVFLTSSAFGNVRLTGFTFDLDDRATDSALRFIRVRGGWSDELVRIDNCEFLGNGHWAYQSVIEAKAFILLDHCLFENVRKDAVHLFGDSQSWGEPTRLGSGRNHFLEDNVVRAREANAAFADAFEGARYVIRHNTLEDISLVNHGYCTSAPGVRHYEIYNNRFVLGSDWNSRGWVPDTWMFLRGGTGVIYDNQLSDLPWQKGEVKFAEFKLGVSGAQCGAVSSTWCCCNPPCSNQIGRGKDDASEPMHFWDNAVNNPTYDGRMTFSMSGDDGRCESICGKQLDIHDFIVEGRDYNANSRSSGYRAYTYPHPLTAGEEAGIAAPTNLRVVDPEGN